MDADSWLSGLFLHKVLRDSKYVGVLIAAAGLALTKDYRFVLAFAVGSAIDIASMAVVVERSSMHAAAADVARTLSAISAVRIVTKSALIAAAAFLDGPAAIWGMILGVLVVEMTILTAGVFESMRS